MEVKSPIESREKVKIPSFVVATSATFLLVGLIVLISYFSPSAREKRALLKNYNQAATSLNAFESLLKADVYGGVKPEETLALFVKALMARDADLASKYFMVNGTMNQGEWRVGIQKMFDENRAEKIIEEIPRAMPVRVSPELKSALFAVKDNHGETTHEILLNFNDWSGVWKIESL